MDLGLRPDEFGRLSIGELAALNEAHFNRVKREDWRAAVITCAILNVHRQKKEDKVFRPHDLMPWLRDSGAKPSVYRQSGEQMRTMLEQMTLDLGGVIEPRGPTLDGLEPGKPKDKP